MDDIDIIDRIKGLRYVHVPQASQLFEEAIAEIERLRGYRDEAESDAAVARLLVDRLRLTDEEREAVETAALEADAHQHAGRAATLRGLLDRVTEPLPKEKRA